MGILGLISGCPRAPVPGEELAINKDSVDAEGSTGATSGGGGFGTYYYSVEGDVPLCVLNTGKLRDANCA